MEKPNIIRFHFTIWGKVQDMKKISDEIGEKYTEWKDGDCIFISSPTGSGKTYFVLNILGPFLIQNNKKALYLVNRRILKEQIDKEIGRICLKTGVVRMPIEVKTYQSIEKEICIGEYREEENGTYKSFVENKMYKDYHQYSYVVCDECHYFLTDSNYNASTAISFRFIQEMFFDQIRIFMSATIESIQEYIKEDNRTRCSSSYTPFYKFGTNYRNMYVDGYYGRYKHYGDGIEKDYRYLDVGIIKGDNEIIDLINDRKNKGKWLIFVDNIQFGEKLEKELNKGDSVNGNQAVFVSSGYKDDTRGLNEFREIADHEIQSARILIATSVLDNGINLKDTKLRNMVIMADNETEFIQMLGRKRADGQRLNLYIYRRDKNTFVRRREQAARRIQIVQEYLKDFYELIQQDIDQMKIMPYKINWEERHKKTEQQLIKRKHIKVMRDIMNSHIRYDDVRSVFCTYEGILYVNLLAYKNLQNLYSYYENIVERMDEDGDDAFIREQLSWLGLAEEEVNKIILGQIEVCRGRVIKAFEEQAKKSSVPKDDFTNFKLTIKDDLILLLEQVAEKDKKYNTVEEAIKKNERVISSNNMDYLRCNCNIPFIVNSNGDGTYTVERAIENIDNQQEVDIQ